MQPKSIEKSETEKLVMSVDHSSDSEDIERIPFGSEILIDIRRWWDKAKKHMELFLEDKESPSPEN